MINNQLELRLLGRVDGPSMVPTSEVARIKTYTEAVAICWANRRVRNMSKTSLAALTGMHASHISDYLSIERKDSHGRELREMPAKYVPLFEALCGNTIITQWFAYRSKLRILDVVVAEAA